MDDDVHALLRTRRHREAFERLLDRYEQKVFRMAVMFLREQGVAEEVTQDIFVKLWQALPAYDGRAAASTWLYTIARNTCLTAVRSASLRRTISIDAASPPIDVAAPAGTDVAMRLDLARCVERLPEVQREVITLFYLQDKNVKDVAEMLDLPVGTVKSHLHRARLALAAMI